MTAKKIDMKQARLDPPSVFSSPEELENTPSLSRAEKIDLLKRWKYGAREVSEANSEGMTGENSNTLHQVSLSLNRLERG